MVAAIHDFLENDPEIDYNLKGTKGKRNRLPFSF